MIEGHVLPMLYVSDVERSVEFYRDKLGFDFEGWWNEEAGGYSETPPSSGVPDFAELRAGDLVLHLHLRREGQDIRGGTVTLHLRVSDVDEYHRSVTAQGGEFSAPRNQPWGWRMFHASDPDGYEWSFYQPS